MARWSAEHPWRAIGLWVVFVVACFVGGNATGSVQLNNDDGGESGRAERIVDSGDFKDQPPTENVIITARNGTLDVGAAKTVAADVTTRMKALPEVLSVDPPVVSRDGTTVLVPVNMRVAVVDDAKKHVQPLLDTTAAAQRAHPDLRVEQAGDASIDKALGETYGNDFQTAEFLSLPVTLAILILAFGALIAAGIPVLLALSSVAAAMGLSTLASHLVPMGNVTSSVILLIGMAVGVDYSLFYLRREREERAKGRKHIDAVEIAAETSGHAVVVSGFAVTIAMAGLFLSGDGTFASLAVGSILVVAVAVIGSLTVLPALLSKLGRWVDRPRVPLLWRLTQPRQAGKHEAGSHDAGAQEAGVAGAAGAAAGGRDPRFWSAVLKPALRHPGITLAIAVALLLALAAPALGMKLNLPGMQDVPRTTATMQAYDRLAKAFPTNGTSHLVAVQVPAGQLDAVKAELTALAQRTQGDRLYAPITGAPDIKVSPNGTVVTMDVATPYEARSEEARASLRKLRADLVPATVGKVPGAKYAVGGFVGADIDFATNVKDKLPLVAGFVLVLTFLVMAFTFRSVVIALTSIVLNMLSAAASYGLLVLVFQHTWAEGILHVKMTGSVVTWLPLFLFVVLFGLSMDYHVFVVSRIREARLRGLPNREAVRYGITTSAGTVTSAAIVMVAVFAIFATLSMMDFKQLGVGLAAAILLDATVIRAVVLPSVMALLGEANWWAPKFLRRKQPMPVADEPERELVSV
jgi:RND superfamily putative drug exporter